MAKAELSIAGKRYALSCAPGQESRLEELGARLDARVRGLIDALGDIGPERLFLAAGLSLLDELDAESLASGTKALDDRIRGLETRAATALAEAAARIEALSHRVDEAS
ncbi:MAG: cell division protein ZapA [Alphaproteobacteria bacterium]|nr:cell division protein ZapA [Alphaproteobacteria bacterium]